VNRDRLFASSARSEEETGAIKDALSSALSIERVYLVELADAEGVVHASIEKTVYIRKREGQPR